MPDRLPLDPCAPASPLGCLLPEGHHYYVTTPLRWVVAPRPYGDSPDPGEEGCDYVEVVARNRQDARVVACRTKDFSDWVNEARGDNKPPFAGLTVEEMLCEHGRCWGCIEECTECEAEGRAAYEEQIAAEEVQRQIAACGSCNEIGLVWDPTVDGNVVPCHHEHHRSGDAGAHDAIKDESGRNESVGCNEGEISRLPLSYRNPRGI